MEKFAETKKKAEKRAENKSSAVRSAARRSGERAKTKKASRTLVEDAARRADTRKRRKVLENWRNLAPKVALSDDDDWGGITAFTPEKLKQWHEDYDATVAANRARDPNFDIWDGK